MGLGSGLKFYYELDNANDSLGSNNLSGTAPSYASAGIIGNGATFTAASSQYLANTAFTGSNDWFFSIWIKPTRTNVYEVVISKDLVDSNRIFSLDHANDNTWQFNAWNSSGTQYTYAVASGMSAGTWYHIVGVWDSTANRMYLYKNGVEYGSPVTTTGTAKTTSKPLCLGRQNAGSPSLYYDGMIDEVGFWDRIPATGEIASLYNGGAGFTYPFIISQTLNESVVLSDTISKRPGKVLGEVVTLVETLTKSRLYNKVFTEVATLVDTISQKITGKTLTESTTVVDSLTRSMTRSLNDIITLDATIDLVSVISREFSDQVSVEDNIVRDTTKILGEEITLTPDVIEQGQYSRVLDDEIDLVDTQQNSLQRTLSEIALLTDSLSRLGTFSRTLAEAITLVQRFQGLKNGVDISWVRKYANQAGSFAAKYSNQVGTFIKKYLDIP